MSDTEDRWYVEIAGKVEMMSLDELVEAYEAGTISAKTLVTEVGESEWHTLAEVADLPEEEEPAPQSMRLPAPPVVAAPVRAAPQSFPPPASSRESAWPPAAAWGPVTNAPVARSVPPSMPPASFSPVVQDLDLGGLDDMQFKRSKGKTAFIALAAVAVLGAGGFGIVKASSVPPTAAVPVPAAAPLAAPSPASLGDWKTPLNPTPAPASPAPTTASTDSEDKEKALDSRLSEDTKAALAAKDKDTAAKKKGAKATRGAVRASSRRGGSSSSSGVFRSGGSADDPLNSKL